MWPNIMTQDEDILVKTQDEDILAHVCYECMDKQRQLCEQDSPEGKKQDTSVANPAPSKKAPTGGVRVCACACACVCVCVCV